MLKVFVLFASVFIFVLFFVCFCLLLFLCEGVWVCVVCVVQSLSIDKSIYLATTLLSTTVLIVKFFFLIFAETLIRVIKMVLLPRASVCICKTCTHVKN